MQHLFEKIDAASHIVVIAHINPDADSLGSASAMYTQMLRLQKKITFFCATENIDRRLAFLPWFDKIRHQFPSSADLAISLDCGSYARLGVEPDCFLINIDHHSANSAYGDMNIIDTGAISTTQVLFELFEQENITPNVKMATALYAGLLDDSFGFLSEKVDTQAFKMAAELCEAGALVHQCAVELFQRHSLAALRLKGLMLQEMRLADEGRIAILTVSLEMMLQSGAHGADCEAALHESMGLPTVQSALLLREKSNGVLKGSLRSETTLDVSAIAEYFGGGGHYHAAGFEIAEMSMAEAEREILKKMRKE